MARDDSAAGTVIVAFVLGAITGAAVALLMAPATGEETRRVLADKAREGRERATEAGGGDGGCVWAEGVRGGSDPPTEAAKQGREFVNRQRDTLSSAIDRGREAYEQARSGATRPATGGGEPL